MKTFLRMKNVILCISASQLSGYRPAKCNKSEHESNIRDTKVHHIAFEMNAAAKSINLAFILIKPWHVLQSEENYFSLFLPVWKGTDRDMTTAFCSGCFTGLMTILLPVSWPNTNLPPHINQRSYLYIMIDPLHRRKPSFCFGEQPHRKLKQAGQLLVQGEKRRRTKGLMFNKWYH